MSSDKQCCVPGCKESGEMHRVLHSFPNPDRDKLRFNSWLYKIGGPVMSLPNDYIYKYRRVCRAHFETKHLCRNNRLSNIAVPNLNIPGLLSPQRLLIANPMQAICIQPNRSSTLSGKYLSYIMVNMFIFQLHAVSCM